MNPRQAQRLIVTGAIAAAALIAWGWIRDGQTPPPSAFVYVVGLYGALALLADLGAPELAGALALALTVGLAFRLLQSRGAQGRREGPASARVRAVVRRTPTRMAARQAARAD